MPHRLRQSLLLIGATSDAVSMGSCQNMAPEGKLLSPITTSTRSIAILSVSGHSFGP